MKKGRQGERREGTMDMGRLKPGNFGGFSEERAFDSCPMTKQTSLLRLASDMKKSKWWPKVI